MRPPKHRPLGWSPPLKVADAFYLSKGWRDPELCPRARSRHLPALQGLAGADTVHHIIERKDGGSDEPSNLEAVHRRCHAALHPNKGRRHD